MSLDELDKLISEIDALLKELTGLIDEEAKGGPGSGCHGDHCGRPSGGHSNDTKPSGDGPKKPRSGVRPSAVNPNRHEIEYHEEPRADNRPRSGVRPGKA